MQEPLRIYSSSRPEALAFAKTVAENLNLPSEVLDLSDLPKPDTQRPTRQQLLTERQELQARFNALQKLIDSVDETEATKEAAADEALTLSERLLAVNHALLRNERAGLVSKNNGLSAKIDRLASASTRYGGELDAWLDEILANVVRINSIDSWLEWEEGQQHE